MTPETISDLVDDNIHNSDEFVPNNDFADYEHENNAHDQNYYSGLGKHGFFIEAQIQAIENIVKNAGWLDESPDGMIPIRDCYNSDPQIFTHSYFLICCIITEPINKILKAIDKAHLLAMIKQYKLELF